MTKPRKRKPGRPRGTTRGGSHVVSIRVNDAELAELMTVGPSPSAVVKRRAFPEPDGASAPRGCETCKGGDETFSHGECSLPDCDHEEPCPTCGGALPGEPDGASETKGQP
jgi:DnaJ-class molecular chaperone